MNQTELNCVSICAIANKTNILHTYIFPLTNTCTCIHILKCVRIHVESSSSSCAQILLFLLPKYAISIVEFLGRENEKTRWDKKAGEWREKARARERKQTIEIRAQHKRSKKRIYTDTESIDIWNFTGKSVRFRAAPYNFFHLTCSRFIWRFTASNMKTKE